MRFTWLHISDLHTGMSDEEYLFPSVRKRFFEDLEYLLNKTGPVDLVLFTGDLAYRGSQEEYTQVDQILNRLCEELKKISGNSPGLVSVPGNHDLVRPQNLETLTRLKALGGDSEAQSTFWHEADAALRKEVENMFRGYTEWWERTSLPKVSAFRRGSLPGDFSATFEKEGHRVGLLGLNTAFTNVADDQKGKLAVDIRQLVGAIPGDYEDWFDGHDFSLLLTHHPENWFSDTCRPGFLEMRPPGRFAVHLFGHMHEGSFTTFRYGSGGALNLFQAPSLFGLEHYERGEERIHGYCVGQIDLDNETLAFWPRRATRTQGGTWDFERDGSVGLPKDADHTDLISLTATAPPPLAKLRIEDITDPKKQRDDLRSAIQINNNKLPETERYDESIFAKLITRHLLGNFGPNRVSAYWKAHLLVAKYGSELVGMLLGYTDFSANFSFISYMAAKDPRLDVFNEEQISEELLEEFVRARLQTKTSQPPRFVSEVDDPARTNDLAERRTRVARIALFDKIAAYSPFDLRVLDFAYLQPRLDPWAGDVPEKDLVLLYAAEHIPARFSRIEVLEILTWTYTQLYAANMFDDTADFERYMGYINELLKRVSNKLTDSVEPHA
jgi:predicted MPP superfamily phosphohydrolase